MEAIAYLHLCTVHEEAKVNPDAGELKLFEGFNGQPPSSGWIRFTSLVVALSILSLESHASAYVATVRTNGSNLNVRTGPGIEYRVVDSLPNGSRINLNGNRSDGWSQLSRIRDWVSSYWIRRGGSGSRYSRSSGTRTRVVYVSRYVSRSTPYCSPNVTSLQQELRSQGYFSGRVTGCYGQQTDVALINYLNNNPPNTTGTGGTTPSNTNTAQACYGGILPSDTRGIEVATLQQRLRDLGYYQDQVTAVYDQATDNAVASFQQTNQYRLRLSTTCTNNRQATLKLLQTAWAAPYPDLAIARLQQRLRLLGFLNGQTTGRYDNTTRNAVREFQAQYQSRYGLQPNGNLTQKTQRAVAQVYNEAINQIAYGTNDPYTNYGPSSYNYDQTY